MEKKQAKGAKAFDNLAAGEQKVLHKLGIRKQLKLVKQLTKAYNKLCSDCRRLVMEDSRRPLESYCPVCKDILGEIMEGFK